MNPQSFADLGVTHAVVSCLAKQGITSPFAIQQVVIGDVLAGRDVLAKSPTGSGKTLAFGIPMVQLIAADGPRPAALVLAPTRELATQIVDDIRGVAHTRALKIAAVYGGVGLVKQAEIAARAHILVATPGRLEDLLARGAFTLDQVQILVLDEADRMLDMGFRPAVDRVVAACRSVRQTLFFSATLDGEAGVIARRYTRDAVVHEQGPKARRASLDVEHRFLEVADERRVEALVRELDRERELTLVFVRTKHGADRLVKRLGRQGVNALAMHGNRSQRQREVALARFESGAVDVLVATDVAARGIDVRGISHVINFDPPADGDTYVHRIGRTGRAGSSGVGITLVGAAQRREVSQIARELGLPHGLDGGAGADAGAPARRERPAPRTGSRPKTSHAGSRPKTPHASPGAPRSHRRRNRPRTAGRS
jgi:ATP-dependent RNA helicase RhlE